MFETIVRAMFRETDRLTNSIGNIAERYMRVARCRMAETITNDFLIRI